MTTLFLLAVTPHAIAPTIMPMLKRATMVPTAVPSKLNWVLSMVA
jgi:hypothetical protein